VPGGASCRKDSSGRSVAGGGTGGRAEGDSRSGGRGQGGIISWGIVLQQSQGGTAVGRSVGKAGAIQSVSCMACSPPVLE
jgi:hypothetical protein